MHLFDPIGIKLDSKGTWTGLVPRYWASWCRMDCQPKNRTNKLKSRTCWKEVPAWNNILTKLSKSPWPTAHILPFQSCDLKRGSAGTKQAWVICGWPSPSISFVFGHPRLHLMHPRYTFPNMVWDSNMLKCIMYIHIYIYIYIYIYIHMYVMHVGPIIGLIAHNSWLYTIYFGMSWLYTLLVTNIIYLAELQELELWPAFVSVEALSFFLEGNCRKCHVDSAEFHKDSAVQDPAEGWNHWIWSLVYWIYWCS